MSLLALILFSIAGLVLLFAATYAFARRVDNYGVVDVVWAFAFGAVAIFCALAGHGWPVRRALTAALVLGWCLRLGIHLFIRVRDHHPLEDGRYTALRKTWKHGFAVKMAVFFQQQALSVALLCLPFFLSASNASPHLHPLEIIGVILWAAALIGESIADTQLKAFRRQRPGGICDTGLWSVSRHPNYFFEWCVWIAYFVFASASPWGWVSVICPAIMFYLLTQVTGVPMAEQQSLRSKGASYKRYQQAVPSAFFPKLSSRKP